MTRNRLRGHNRRHGRHPMPVRRLLHALAQREKALVDLRLLTNELLVNVTHLLDLLLPEPNRWVVGDGRHDRSWSKQPRRSDRR